MPTAARKFLMAGKSGLNITHSEPFDQFVNKYGKDTSLIKPALDHFTPQQIVQWMNGLGIETFVGSSGRVFPKEMKASPLLRNWLKLLETQGVTLHTGYTWKGWTSSGKLVFDSPEGDTHCTPYCTILALGGASWSRLGSKGDWTDTLAEKAVHLAPFQPANCGFNIKWSAHFKERFAGLPVKNVTIFIGGQHKQGEFVITENGVEGSLIYAVSASIRDTLQSDENPTIRLDLAPQYSSSQLLDRLRKSRGKRTLSNFLRKQTGIDGVKLGLLYEFSGKDTMQNPETLTNAIKGLTILIDSTRPIDEAISVAGGVCFNNLNENLMFRNMPGLFCAGEMIDWEAPTGGYLITACMAQGHQAARGAIEWLKTSKGKNEKSIPGS